MTMKSFLGGCLLLVATAVSTVQAAAVQSDWPVPQIQSPVIGTKFIVDNKLKLIGSATDGAGNKLPDSSLTWEIRYRSTKNKEHHPFLVPTQGNNIEINGKLEPRNLKSAKDSYLEVLLTATDAKGLSTTTKLILEPRIAEVDFDSNPSGLDLHLDGEIFKMPVTITTWENHKFNIRADSQTNNDGQYKFIGWSDGGRRSHKYQVSIVKNSVVADFELVLPQPVIHSIEEGTRFTVGESFVLSGSATDGFGVRLPESSLTWAVRLYNEKHDKSRTILNSHQGNKITFDAPAPKDFDEADSSYLQVLLTATDSAGVSSTKTLIMKPEKVNLVFKTEPEGLALFLDGGRFRHSSTLTSWEGHKFKIEAPAQRKRDVVYVWKSWSDKGQQAHEYVTPPAKRFNDPHTVVASFGEPTPEEPQSSKPMVIGISFFVAVLILVLCVIVFIAWKKKRGISIINVGDASVHGDKSKKSAGTGVHTSVDDFDLPEIPKEKDNESQMTVDQSGISNVVSVAEESASSSSTDSSDSIVLPTPLNLSKYLLSSVLARDEEEGEDEKTHVGTHNLSVSKGYEDVPLS